MSGREPSWPDVSRSLRSLADPEVASSGRFGGKAAMLSRMHAESLPVLPGLALPAAVYELALEAAQAETTAATLWGLDWGLNGASEEAGPLSAEIERALVALDVFALAGAVIEALDGEAQAATELIVRSSATGEDSLRLSYAGQFRSLRCDRDPGEVGAALKAVWASCTAPNVAAYRAAMAADGAVEPPAMGLVVQPFRRFSLAGVLFTQHPTVPLRGWSLIEYLDEDPERLVAGEVLPHRCRVNAVSGEVVWERRVEGRPVLGEDLLLELLAAADRLRSIAGSDVDVEWGASDGSVCLLQARPATTRPRGG